MSTTILMLRHGEEPQIKPNLDLSKAGNKRAACLAEFIPTTFGKPGFIFAAAPSPSSVRCYLTMRPLASVLKTTIDASFKGEDFAPLAFRLLGDPALRDELVVVCWTHKELPSLAAYLNVSRGDFPTQWPDELYDRIYQVTSRNGARPKVKAIAQPF